jgi:transposase-like protein
MTTCPKCGTFRIKKYGFRKNKRGVFQKFRCKSCKKQFIDDNFLWMQTPKEAVSTAVRLKTKSSMSAELVMEEIEKIYGIKRCPSLVFVWIDKYSKMFEIINHMPLYGISKRLHMDHTELSINGEKAYFWGVLCPHTRLIAGWHLSMSKEFENAKEVLRKAKNRFPIGYELEEMVTDGENSFPRAIWEVYDHSVRHYRYKGFVDKKNNNTIETLWNFTNFIPKFCSFEQAKKFFTIWVAVYNMKRSRQLAESGGACKIAQMIKIWT